MKLFGWEIKRPNPESQEMKSFVVPESQAGSMEVAAYGGGAYGSVVDLDGTSRNEAELVTRYRRMLMQPEVQYAVDDIVNEAIVVSEVDPVVNINLDDVDLSESIKEKIRTEFKHVLKLLHFNEDAYTTFQKWYVDGRLYYHAIVDEASMKKVGIEEIRYIDPRKIRHVREVETITNPKTKTPIKRVKSEYYVYSEKGFLKTPTTTQAATYAPSIDGLKIAKDSIIHVTSGLVNETNDLVVSHLHKAIKTMNQLHMLEDATVIYRISRAPERRIFYIDVGNLPKAKAEQYLRDMMVRYKNKAAYDPVTGEIRDARKFQTMLEDFWLPRREGGKGTEITSLPGGQNLGEIEDLLYFQKKLYKSLNVPISRLESETGFSFGRPSEITRDEIKFSKFITRLRRRFSHLFLDLLFKQLVLKNIIRPEEWDLFSDDIRFDFMQDNHFEEVKEMEILRERIATLRDMEDMVGVYFSKAWVRKNVLHQTDDDIEEIQKDLADENGEDQQFSQPGATMTAPDGETQLMPVDPPQDQPAANQPQPAAKNKQTDK